MLYWIHERIEEAKIRDSTIFTKIELACEEALVNVINYAYPKYAYPKGSEEVSIAVDLIVINSNLQAIRVVITDHGIPFDPLPHLQKTPPLPKPLKKELRQPLGGYGIFLIKELMDDVKYSRTDSKNQLVLIKYL
jgi:serine/threonine-protein kinase RsbW